MSRADEVYKPALDGKKIPLLTIDNKWHRLFTQTESTPNIHRLEKDLNNLLKRQGKITTETKEIKKLKTKLMNEIVQIMDTLESHPDKENEKKIADNKRLIAECNEKLESYQDEMLDLPKELDRVNLELMLETMQSCYDTLKSNTEDIEKIAEWISYIRIELKKNVIRKQEKEIMNQQLYSYMHDIFGADVINIFDMKYNPSEQLMKKSDSPAKT